MAERYNLVIPHETNEKTHWTRIGVMFPMKNKDGFNIIFNALPMPTYNSTTREVECRVIAFKHTDREDGPPANRGSEDDDIPF